MTEPAEQYEPMTPVGVERWLRHSITKLTHAEKALREARDAETTADIDYRRAHRRAMLSPQCPRVTRGGYTTADRDAWVDDQCDAEWEAYRLAVKTREAAQDHLRTTREISNAVQSLGALVRSTYTMAGHS